MFGQIDIEDAIAGTVFVLSAAVSLGIAGGQTYYGYDISQALWTIEGTAVTTAFLLTVGALAAAYVTNRTDRSSADFDVETDLKNLLTGDATVESYVLLGTIVIVLGIGLNVLGFRDIAQSNYIISTTLLLIEGSGYYVISYLG